MTYDYKQASAQGSQGRSNVAGPSPGKQTLTEQLPVVQRKAATGPGADGDTASRPAASAAS
ncbi:MAG TPA: hypothetical protein VK932_03155 [Kofleriaceae bacterium]|nr:hypothetical protein [Kofleriaceae bacterium]